MVSGAFYYRLDVCNLRKLLLQTQFLSNYPAIIIPQVKSYLRHRHLLLTVNAKMKLNTFLLISSYVLLKENINIFNNFVISQYA